MVAAPALGVSSTANSGPSQAMDSKSASNNPIYAANQPFSLRRAPALDLSTVERKGQPLGPKEKTNRIRPHGLEEAPTFRPTVEEFADPIEYIKKIAPEGRKYGICKIIPPDSWNPPFAIDTEKFHFRTRKQELNSIEGSTRTNLNYLDQLSKFHKQFGNTLVRFPSVDKRPLDLYKLKKAVEARGGFDKVCKVKKWAEIGRDLGYSGKIMSSLSTSLKGSYQKWLYPYEEWVRLAKPSLQQMMEMEKAGTYTPPSNSPFPSSSQATPNGMDEDSVIIKDSSPSSPKQQSKSSEPESMEIDSPVPPPRTSSGFTPVNAGFTPVNGFIPVNSIYSTKREDSMSTPQRSVEGPNTSAYGTPDLPTTNGHALKRTISRDTNGELSDIDSPGADDSDARKHKRQKKESSHTVAGSHTSLLKPNGSTTPKQPSTFQANSKPGERCEACGLNEDPSKLVICDSCDNGAHKNCIDPPLKSPNAAYHCHKCLVGTGEFGFQEGGVYSLKEFQEKANKFKEDYFAPKLQFDPVLNTKRPVNEDEVEREFWRLVESLTETVEVEYGADVHVTTHGSGFPDLEKDPTSPYATDPWNLNVLPLHPDSLFRHIKSDVSGMTVPWLYVGMVFSTFCWHNEDHYTYSANYQHFGATKTWYGIPGADADRFEKAMKEAVPELFEQQPDLLFQLVTLLPPDQLKKAGVNVYALDQRAGQFVITFPQAYHAGFNHGFNFNEAVNFAPSDWEPFGQAGVERLQEFRRQACFSHDELLMNAAARDTSIKSAKWLAPALERVLHRELSQRSSFVPKHQEIKHVCNINAKKLDDTTHCNLTYEVNDQDLQEDEYPCVYCKAYTYLSRFLCKKSGKIMCLLHAGSHPCCDVEESVRFQGTDHTLVYKLSDDDLREAVQKVYDRARLPELWQEKVDKVMDEDASPPLKTLRSLLAEGERIPYELPGLIDLKPFVDRCNEWVEEATNYITRKQQNRRKNERAWRRGTNNATKAVTEAEEKEHRRIENIHRLLDQAQSIGFDCPEIATLKERKQSIEEHQKAAQNVLARPDAHTTEDIEALAEQGKSFNVDIPEVELLEQYLTKRKWVDEARTLRDVTSTLPQVDALLERATKVGIEEDHILKIWWRDQKEKGEIWERKAHELMQAETMHYHQLEALCNQATVVPVTPKTLAALDAILLKQREAHKQVLAMNERSKDPDFSKRPKYKDVRTVLDSLAELSVRPSGTVELEKDVKRNEDWMRKGKKLFGKSNAPLHILHSHMVLVRDRNLNCFNLEERPSLPVEPSSREASPAGSDNIVASGEAKRFCLCRLPESGTMIECDICHEWYHSRCLKLARGKVKDDDKYACPICDHRGKIPRDAARPKLEDLTDWQNEIPKLPFQPEEEELLTSIIDRGLEFRRFVAPWCNPDGDPDPYSGVNLDVVSKRFYLRKIEGADILLAFETNYLRQELYKLVPVAPEPPPIMNESHSTRKPRPTKQQKLMAQLGISNPEDLPQELRTKQHTFKHLEKKKPEIPTTRLSHNLQPAPTFSKSSGTIPPAAMANMTRPAAIAVTAPDPVYANMFATSPNVSPQGWQNSGPTNRPNIIDTPNSPIFRPPETPPPVSSNLDPSLFSPSNNGFAAAALREVVSAQPMASPRMIHSRGTSNGGDLENLFANFTNDNTEERNEAGEALEGLGPSGSSPVPESDVQRLADEFLT